MDTHLYQKHPLDIDTREMVAQVWKGRMKISAVGLFEARDGDRGGKMGLHCCGMNKRSRHSK